MLDGLVSSHPQNKLECLFVAVFQDNQTIMRKARQTQTDRQAASQREWTDRQAGSQREWTDRQAGSQREWTDRQTDGQTDISLLEYA